VSDRGYVAYKMQFQKSTPDKKLPPCVLLFTHSMLAQDMRRKVMLAGQDETYQEMQKFYFQTLRNMKGKARLDLTSEIEALDIIESELGVALNSATDGRSVLPEFMCLMVDEGHLLDESFSSSLSEFLSLSSLLTSLHKYQSLGSRIGATDMEAVGSSIQALIKAAPKVDKRDFVSLSSDSESRLIPHLRAIANVCEAISKPRDQDSERYRLYLSIRRAGFLIAASSFLRHSPIRYLPQLMVSNSNVKTVLSRLWSSLESAALVSATLYLPTSDGPSGSFMAGLLQVPQPRAKFFSPVHASWSTACVQGAWVAQSTDSWLYPPKMMVPGTKTLYTKQEADAVELQWHQEVSDEVHTIWDTAAGGVLVLCTSYATVKAVSAMLIDRGLGESIVSAAPELSLRTQSQNFLRVSHQGLKPLWIAVGAAWTGLDIGGHEPWEELFGAQIPANRDNVLTDLVIPRLPFRTNQSLTHMWRIRNAPNVPWDLLDAALRFKQALGRLVRRVGLPSNRRIHILDARLGDPVRASQLVPFDKSLAKYKRLSVTRKDTNYQQVTKRC
jgi:CRISPR type IV-associated DEAD/DEAH-box helicase Csf4